MSRLVTPLRLAAGLAAVAVGLAVGGLAVFHAASTVPTEVRLPDARLDTVRLVVHPGLGGRPERVAAAIAGALQAAGMRVEIVGLQGYAPTPLVASRAVVLVVPTLFGAAPRSVRAGLEREPLAGKRVFVVACPIAGTGVGASTRLLEDVRRAGGVPSGPIVVREPEARALAGLVAGLEGR